MQSLHKLCIMLNGQIYIVNYGHSVAKSVHFHLFSRGKNTNGSCWMDSDGQKFHLIRADSSRWIWIHLSRRSQSLIHLLQRPVNSTVKITIWYGPYRFKRFELICPLASPLVLSSPQILKFLVNQWDLVQNLISWAKWRLQTKQLFTPNCYKADTLISESSDVSFTMPNWSQRTRSTEVCLAGTALRAHL